MPAGLSAEVAAKGLVAGGFSSFSNHQQLYWRCVILEAQSSVLHLMRLLACQQRMTAEGMGANYRSDLLEMMTSLLEYSPFKTAFEAWHA